MREFIIRRLLLLFPIMLAVAFLTFLAFQLIPGDPTGPRCGIDCPEDVREALRHQWGLDRPWYVQFWDWLNGIPRGDFGESFVTGLPVTTELERRLPVTIQLTIMTLLFSIVLGIPAGIVSAVRPSTPLDWGTRLATVFWLSVPSYWIAIVVIALSVRWLNWVPPQFGLGYVPFFDDPWINLQQFLLPSLILSLGIAAGLMRLTRSSLLEVLRNDYIRTAWAKGLRERTVVMRHALKNALIPVTTVLGLQIGALLTGTVLMEFVFALNGIGSYVLVATFTRDFVVVQGIVILFALAFVLAQLAVDVAYAWLDPRIRYA